MKNQLIISLLVALTTVGCGEPPVDDEAAAEVTAADAEALFDEASDTSPRDPSSSSVVYTAEAVIDAPIELVWSLLTDLPGYSDWNPWVVEAEGTLAPGGRVGVQVVLNGIEQHAEHVVLTVDPEKTLCWRDAGWTTRFVYGQRCRWLDVGTDGKVHFTQQVLLDKNADGLNFSGMAKLFYGPALQAGIDSETGALVAESEAESH